MRHATGISENAFGIYAYLRFPLVVAVATSALPSVRCLSCSCCAGGYCYSPQASTSSGNALRAPRVYSRSRSNSSGTSCSTCRPAVSNGHTAGCAGVHAAMTPSQSWRCGRQVLQNSGRYDVNSWPLRGIRDAVNAGVARNKVVRGRDVPSAVLLLRLRVSDCALRRAILEIGRWPQECGAATR